MSLSTKIKELLRPWVQKIRKMLNPVPLWIQLIFIMILLTTAVSVQLVHKDYTSTKELTLSQYLSTTSQILSLEAENSDWYLDSLAKFCIQPYYDSSYTRIIDQKTPITTEQLSYVKQQMFYNYYTRSDILDYELYLINQDMIIGRNESQQHFTVQQNMDIQPFLDAAENARAAHGTFILKVMLPVISPITTHCLPSQARSSRPSSRSPLMTALPDGS